MVGSHAILGTFREDALPADATISVEVDILPIANLAGRVEQVGSLNCAVAAAASPYRTAWAMRASRQIRMFE